MLAHELFRSTRRRSVAALTCAALSLAGFAPRAAAAPAQGEAAAPEKSETSEAEALFRRGQAKYETADYTGAIELWTEAYALVESVPENAGIKAVLLYNVAQAHVKAYELYEDPIHLKKALQLLQGFRGGIAVLYADEAARDEEYKKVDAKIAELEAALDAHEAKTEGPAEPPPKEDPVEPPPPAPTNPGRPLIITGGAVLGLGVAFGGVGLVGALIGSNANDIDDLDPLDLQAREERFRGGEAGNALAFTGLVIGGVFVPVGAALIAVGVKRNKAANARPQALVLPTFGSGGAGLSLTGRF